MKTLLQSQGDREKMKEDLAHGSLMITLVHEERVQLKDLLSRRAATSKNDGDLFDILLGMVLGCNGDGGHHNVGFII